MGKVKAYTQDPEYKRDQVAEAVALVVLYLIILGIKYAKYRKV